MEHKKQGILMVHFFFYALSISLYTAAVFAAGMYVGEKLEGLWEAEQKLDRR